jgi:Tfp pilus assembly protein PilX
MTRRLTSQRGSALVTAMLAIMVMMMLGLASLSFVDGQSRATGKERTQESSFNAAEAALSGESATLAQKWPGAVDKQMPVCTYSNGTLTTNPPAQADRCPNAAALTQTLASKDFSNNNLTWTVEVRDNTGGEQCTATTATNCGYYWDDVTNRGYATWDANGDLEMWVRAQSVVRGQRRTIVGRVRVTKVNVQFPKSAVTAGSFKVGSSGSKKHYITLNGSTMALRCDMNVPEPARSACLKEGRPGENIVYPGTIDSPYDDGGSVLTESQLNQLRQTADANGTYYPAGTCPPSTIAGYTGAVVFVESADCKLTGNGTINSAAKPGLIVFAAGTLKFTGTKTVYGTIYLANGQHSTADDLLDLGGNSTVIGSVMVDGAAGLAVTGSDQVVYDANAQQNFSTITGAGLIRSSFRELDV